MQHSHHANGHVPPTNGTSSQASLQGDHGWLRTPTVAEALPFTPFSSIVPFNPGKTLCAPRHVLPNNHMLACCDQMNLANTSCRSYSPTTCNAFLQRQLRSRRPSKFTPCLGETECRSHKCRRRFQALSANDKRCAQATRCGEPDKIPLQEATPYTTKQLRERSRPTPIARAESVRKDGFGDDACFIPLPYSGVTRDAARFVSEWQEVEQTHCTKRSVNAAIHSQSSNHSAT